MVVPLEQAKALLDSPLDEQEEEKKPEGRLFHDPLAARQAIYQQVLETTKNLEPIENENLRLELRDVEWMDPERFSRKERKHAVLTGGTIARRLRGTWVLTDKTAGEVIDKKKSIIARVPYLSSMGTFIHRGNHYTVTNQPRLLPGVYSRRKENGEIETHVNILPEHGVSHRYMLDPEKGIFKVRVGQAEIPLAPLLRSLGATDEEIARYWGKEIFQANSAYLNDTNLLKKLGSKFLPKYKQITDPAQISQALAERFLTTSIDPEVSRRNLGKPYDKLDKEVVLAATNKLLRLSRGEAEPDDRDHLANQKFYGVEDLFSERIARNHAKILKPYFRKIVTSRSLKDLPTGIYTGQFEHVLLNTGLGQALEEINPAEILDKQTRLTRMGEGGIPDVEAIPEEARSVQPSHMGFIDPVRAPESLRVGVDVQATRNAIKGKDGQLYMPLRTVDGKEVWRSPRQLADAVIATTDALRWPTKRIPVMKQGKMVYAPREEVQYVLPHFEDAFSPVTNMVPLKSMVKGQRVAMGAKYLTQALPLAEPESPLVQTGIPGTGGQRSFEEEYSEAMGAVIAKKPGRVDSIQNGIVKLKYDDGTTEEIEMYDHYPFNRKTFIHQTPILKPGDRFDAGQAIIRSNYTTDKKGVTALGVNLKVAYMPWRGYNFEDAIVISESAAKKLSSVHMYQNEIEMTEKHKPGKNTFISIFPNKFDKKVLEKIDDQGTVKVGTVVNYGEPLILMAQQRDHAQNKVHRRKQAGYVDASIVWTHHDPGIVTDVAWGKNGPMVVVKSFSPMRVGDKLSGRYGDKGVISAIVPDNEMPLGQDGKPFEILMNPLGLITRVNPAQIAEAMLGKIAAKTGKPIKVEDFEDDRDKMQWVLEQLRKHNLTEQEDLIDQRTGAKIPGVTTGNRFFMKLHHTAESKLQGRGGGAYSADDSPAKGGESGSKRVSLMDVNALVAHGAVETLKDAGAIRGQRNETWWLQFMMGHTPPKVKVPMVYEKFVNQLKAAGINPVREGYKTQIMAMTDKDIEQIAEGRFIEKGETVHWDKDLKPITGGLFDPSLTGGHNGKLWAAIKLPEPLPNPVMEEPIRRVLGLTKKQLEAVIAGEQTLGNFGTGPKALKQALASINLDQEIEKVKAQWYNSRGTKRDEALRRWKYLDSAKKLNIHPQEWMVSAVPVLPPAYRPVTIMSGSDTPMVDDVNFMYKQLLDAKDNYNKALPLLGEENLGQERLALYNSFRSLVGLTDPVHPKLREKNVKGILKSIFGDNPKFGTVQRKLISSTVDNVGRAVITPNPDYDLDTVGLPEPQAYSVYSRFIVRRLRKLGLPIREAVRHVTEKTDLAKKILLEEMEERPVYINRAPVLHKFGVLAFKPKLVAGDVMQVNPLIVKGFGADFDGDAMQFHVPTTEEAVKEAYEKLMASKSLISPADFKTPVHMPGQEYLGGLYEATRPRKTLPHKTRVFRNRQDAIAAFQRGEITVDTPIHIIQDK